MIERSISRRKAKLTNKEMTMLRKLSITAAAALLATSAYAQGPMQETWDIHAPNGEPMMLGNPQPTTPAPLAQLSMQDTWDINAPNGEPQLTAPTAVAGTHSDPAVHGQFATAAAADRVIEVRPGTRYVNVISGETVLFKVGDKSFTWTFDSTLDHPTFDLAQIAPEGLAVQGVRIYCAPDQYERSA